MLTTLDTLIVREILDVRGKLRGFIKTEIVNADGEFHSVDTSEPPSNNWFNCNSNDNTWTYSFVIDFEL